MDDFSAPSFSLGLDLDLADLPTEGEEDKEEEQRELPLPTPTQARGSPTFDLLSDEEFEEDLGLRETLTPNPDQDPPSPPPALKRLRRVPPAPPPPALKRLRRDPSPPSPPRPPSPAAPCPPCDGGGGGNRGSTIFTDVDDEIEEFSPQEERRHSQVVGGCSSVQSCNTRSSSKFLLHNRGILTSQQRSKLKTPKVSPASNASTSTIVEQSSNKKLFPKLTISPLRKIYLLDSDSDDPSSEDEYEDGKEVDKSQERRQATTMTRNRLEKSSLQANKVHGESFWKDLSCKKNMNLATPALDEICEEYFRSMKDQNSVQSKEEDMNFCSSRIPDPDNFVEDFEDHHQQKHINGRTQQNRNLPNSQPPAYRYFYHSDASIRTLVQKRLPFFNPLGAEKYRGNEESGAENFDYMGQFGSRDVPRQARRSCEGRSEVSSKSRRKPNSDNLKEASHASGSWVNPRSCANIPKDAAKRRVRADGRQSGHWFTSEDGRKVYVAKNGEELTGQIAYKQYKKESGLGFRNSRKKGAVKKKKGNVGRVRRGK